MFRGRCPVVSPPANFWRASGTGDLVVARSLPICETLPHGFEASLVALPSRVQHEKPGTLALADASATRSRIHRRHHPKHGRRGACSGWHGRSPPHRRRSAGDALSRGCDARGEERILTLDSRGTATRRLCVAGGLWAFTFAAPDLEAVRAYVLNQEEHHRVKAFQEEYMAMLKRGMVAYEERFLW